MSISTSAARYRRRLFGLVALIACLGSPSLQAAAPGDSDLVTKMYLDIPGIAGEVTDAKFEGQIEVLSYSGTTTGGPGELSLTKYIDSSSPRIFAIVASGTPLKAARLSVVTTVNGKIDSSMTIDLRDVFITSVVAGGETESITLSFLRSKVTQ